MSKPDIPPAAPSLSRNDTTPAGTSPSRNRLMEIMSRVMPPEVIEWHRNFAAAQRQSRTVIRTCRRCDQTFETIQRGLRRSQWPSICPDRHAQRQREYAAAWRARQKASVGSDRPSCSRNGCGAPIPEGRSDRRWCSSACRQAGYRRRKSDGGAL
jgi:hypothetical protein